MESFNNRPNMSIVDYIFVFLTIISSGMRTYLMKPRRDKSNEKSFLFNAGI
jgi:hypothetical protein